MSVLRQANLLGQARIDAPHLRGIESSIAADFDLLAGRCLTGEQPQVLRGFQVVITGAIGNSASALQLSTANGILLHFLASENGTLFWVPTDRPIEVLSATNTRVSGSFVASQVNYVGLDLVRSADSSTSDLVQFLDPVSLLESPRTVPLARTLDYKIVISTADFSATPSVAPIAKITTDSNNNVTTIEDARTMMFRLGSGGSVPDKSYSYPWPGTRYENLTGDVFSGGDKGISSLKEWQDATMTRLWELGGGEYWYSTTADRNVKLARYGTTLFSNNEHFEWDGTHLHWRGLRFLFDNSTGYYNDVKDQLTNSSGLTNLADGDCLYVDLDRTQNRTGGSALNPVKAVMATMGSPVIPGGRFIVAWRSGANVFTRDSQYAVGTTFLPATTTALGLVKLSVTSGTPSAPVVVAIEEKGAASGVAALNAIQYVLGSGVELAEVSSPANPAAATLRVFAKSNGIVGSGHRTQLVIRWPDGTETVIAESPATP